MTHLRHEEIIPGLHQLLPVLYDLVVTMGKETSVKPLLTHTLQRLLFHTSFAAGFISLDVDASDLGNSADAIEVRVDAAVGDFDLIGLIGKRITLPGGLVCGADECDAGQIEQSFSELGLTHYRSCLKLAVGHSGVVLLLSIEKPETQLPLTRMFKPVMAHLEKAILLCRSNDAQFASAAARQAQTELSLRQSETAFEALVELSPIGVGFSQGEVAINVNRVFLDMFGYGDLSEVAGRSLLNLVAPRRQDALREHIKQISDGALPEKTCETMGLRKDGSEFPVLVSAKRVPTPNGARIFSFFIDLTVQKKNEAQVHQLAFYDSLTHLPNRRLLLDRLQQTTALAERAGQHGAVLFLDLDNFKAINDSRGHAVGDMLLLEVAARLKGCIRDGDTVARLGGDEFVVVLGSLSAQADEAAEQADGVAEKIREALAQPYQLEKYVFYSTSSIGVVVFKGHQQSLDIILKHADAAMYQAKNAGRNVVRFYDSVMQSAIKARAKLETDLRHALEQQQFELYYQVQVDNLYRPVGAEALLRWHHSELGLLLPDRFIPLAEEVGAIVALGKWVLRAGCAQIKAWENNALANKLTLAVNVSAKQLLMPDFVADVEQILRETGANPALLKLELTESALLMNVEETIEKMHKIKSLGVIFSMDDFGTGYSSLQYLKRLPLDQIKIDQSFVRDLVLDSNDAVIVQTIIAMSVALGLNIIAEGVATETQRQLLELRGCHAFQGYLFGRPVPIAEFEAGLMAG